MNSKPAKRRSNVPDNPAPETEPVAEWRVRCLTTPVVAAAAILAYFSWYTFQLLSIISFPIYMFFVYRIHRYFAHQVQCTLCGRVMAPRGHCAPCWRTHLEMAQEKGRSPPIPPY